MAFTPETQDGPAAAAKLLAKKRNKPLACLFEVFHAFPFERSDAPGAYSSARVSWNRTPKSRRHEGDRIPPAGAVVYFKLRIEDETEDPWPGHICLSLGGGRIVSTDWPKRGRIGEATIDELERAWRANEVEYLGWTDWIGGHNVTVAARPGQGSGASTGGKKSGAVYVVTSATFLRKVANTGRGTKIKALKVGQRLRVLKITGPWATLLRTNGTIAFVWAARLTREKLTTTRTTPLRAAASRLGRLIRRLPKGTRVKVIGRVKAGRVQVQVGASKGWAYRKHLK